MSTRGVRRYLSCLDYLEAKYNNEITEDEYDRRRRTYEAFNSEPPLSVPGDLAAEDAAEPADDVDDDNETDTDDDSVGSLIDFIAREDEA